MNETRPKNKTRSPGKFLTKETVSLLILCIVIVLSGKIISTYVILTGDVPSESMENTIMPNDRILTNCLSYINSDPKRGDIIVFYAPDEKASGTLTLYVKRVIGLPGETVIIKNNHVYIQNNKTNGEDKLLVEPYIPTSMVTLPLSESDTFIVPKDCYFMLGDNRTNSLDSRKWEHTFVPKGDIKGKVFIKYQISLSIFKINLLPSYNEYNV